MANTVSLSVDLSVDDIATLNDDTTFGSPVRSSVGVFVTVYKVNSSSVQTEIVSEGNDEDPETDASWTFDVTTDGWYQVYYVSVPDYSTVTTYSQYDAVFDTSSDQVYISLADANLDNALSNESFWELVEDPASLAENEGEEDESENIDSAVYNRILIPKTNRLYGDKALEAARECCGDCERPENVSIFELVFTLKEGALIAETNSEYAEGEKIIRRLDEFNEC